MTKGSAFKMKTFNSFMFERAAQLRSVDLLDSDSYDEAYEKLMKLNPTKLGEGLFSAVFGGEGNLVVKLTDSGTDGTYWYLREAHKRWMNNAHYPRVGAIKSFELSYGYLAVMENLEFSPQKVFRAFKPFDWYEDGYYATTPSNLSLIIVSTAIHFLTTKEYDYNTLTPEQQYKDAGNYLRFIEVFPKMKEIYELCYNLRETKSTEFDLHGENIAARGNTPVIVDPLGASADQYN